MGAFFGSQQINWATHINIIHIPNAYILFIFCKSHISIITLPAPVAIMDKTIQSGAYKETPPQAKDLLANLMIYL